MITTRAAKVEDAQACADILREWIDETPWFKTPNPSSAAETLLRREIETNTLTLALDGSALAGFSGIAGKELNFLYVAAKYRNQGVGKMLLNRCKFAMPDGFGLWTFQQNSAARRFYENAGLLEAERGNGENNEEGLPDIRYIWEGKK